MRAETHSWLIDKTLLAIVGTCLLPARELERRVRRAVQKGNYQDLEQLPGSYWLWVDTSTEAIAAGDLLGYRTLYFVHTPFGIVVSSSALPLQQLIEAEIDDVWIATRWLGAATPALSGTASAFIDIRRVPPGTQLIVRSDGSLRLASNWPIVTDGNLASAANDLSVELEVAVAERAREFGACSADLSGGVDSTGIAVVANRVLESTSQALHVFTYGSIGQGATDDALFSSEVVSSSGNMIPHRLKASDLPLPYSEFNAALIDEPFSAMPMIGRAMEVFRRVAQIGSCGHFSGEGGDEVFGPLLFYLADLVPSRPRQFIQHAWGWAQLRGWNTRRLLLSAIRLRLQSYRQWLTVEANRMTSVGAQPDKRPGVPLGWGITALGAGWLSRDARVAARERMLEWARSAEPYDKLPGQHAAVVNSIEAAQHCRQLNSLSCRVGIRLHAPLLDRRVVQLALSVPTWIRMTPYEIKPLLLRAWRAVLPQSVAGRRTKGDYTHDVYRGLALNRRRLTAFLTEGECAQHGLVDPGALSVGLAHAATGQPTDLRLIGEIFGTEVWLREVKNARLDYWLTAEGTFRRGLYESIDLQVGGARSDPEVFTV